MSLQAGLIFSGQTTAKLAGLGGRVVRSRDALTGLETVGETDASGAFL